jgi:hypothetical protein
MKDALARIDRRTDELRYRFDPQGRWRECKESEERGKMVSDLIFELRMAKDTSLGPGYYQQRADELASQMNQNEIAQATGKRPMHICGCGTVFADEEGLVWHQARLRHLRWEVYALPNPDDCLGYGRKPCELPAELESAGVHVGGPVSFGDEFYPLNPGVLEKVVQMPNGLVVALVRTSSGEIKLVETTKLSLDTISAQTEKPEAGTSS